MPPRPLTLPLPRPASWWRNSCGQTKQKALAHGWAAPRPSRAVHHAAHFTDRRGAVHREVRSPTQGHTAGQSRESNPAASSNVLVLDLALYLASLGGEQRRSSPSPACLLTTRRWEVPGPPLLLHPHNEALPTSGPRPPAPHPGLHPQQVQVRPGHRLPVPWFSALQLRPACHTPGHPPSPPPST